MAALISPKRFSCNGPSPETGHTAQATLFVSVIVVPSRTLTKSKLQGMMPDGTLEILGRIDTQIKLRGVRIESEGISSIIRKAKSSSPTGFLDATTVLARHPNIGSDQLVSFITWDPTVSVATRKSSKPCVADPPATLLEDTRKVCDAEIASYMRPSHIIPINWLPLSSNGKSDEKALVSLFNALELELLARLLVGDLNAKGRARQVTTEEQQVFTILQRHISLPISLPHPDINIFECGIDSMSVVSFAADLNQTLGSSPSASAIMKAATLGSISAAIQHMPITSPAAKTHIQNFSDEHTFEILASYKKPDVEQLLSPFTTQEGILARSADSGSSYIQHVILRPRPKISLRRIRDACESCANRLPILRLLLVDLLTNRRNAYLLTGPSSTSDKP